MELTILTAALIAVAPPQMELLNLPTQETTLVIEPEVKPIEYIVQEGDSLTKIAEAHSVDLRRVWAANPQLTDPDLIQPESALKIPQDDESLQARPMPVRVVPVAPTLATASVGSSVSRPAQPVRVSSVNGLTGSIGWARPTGNCVNTARAHGKIQPGNPITWKVSTQTPFIGAAALFHYNHVSIVSGIYDDGSIEVMHENFRGGRTRFKASEIRGYF